MAHRPRVSLLALTLSLSASSFAAKITPASLIPTVTLSGGMAGPQLAELPSLTNQGVSPQVPLSVPELLTSIPAGGGMSVQSLGAQTSEIVAAVAADPSGMAGKEGIDVLYSGRARQGGSDRSASSVAGRFGRSAPVFIKNDEGVWIMDRAAATYKEIRRLVARLSPRMGLQESLDVMDGTIADVRVKLLTLEAIAKDRKVADANTHLEGTLTFVDGVLDDGDRRIAVHTHQVYFHPAPAGPQKAASEISEGIRRVDSYLKTAERHFAPGADAEAALGRLDEVVLGFDTRGYQQIKDHLKQREAEFKRKFGDRIRFAYVDELAPTAKDIAEVRADYNRLIEKYKGDTGGVQKIQEGVMYSRYVGVLHELTTLEYYDQRGYVVMQSGRDMFGADGKYITELDAVVRSPKGQVILVEAKSARVQIPHQDVLDEKVIYKLDIYKKHQAEIEKMIGAPLEVVFSFDVGGRDAQAAQRGELVWQNENQRELKEFLEAQAPILSAKYGFKVSFLFLNSHPNEDPMLFYRKPVSAQGMAVSNRKHGRK